MVEKKHQWGILSSREERTVGNLEHAFRNILLDAVLNVQDSHHSGRITSMVTGHYPIEKTKIWEELAVRLWAVVWAVVVQGKKVSHIFGHTWTLQCLIIYYGIDFGIMGLAISYSTGKKNRLKSRKALSELKPLLGSLEAVTFLSALLSSDLLFCTDAVPSFSFFSCRSLLLK